MSRNNKLVIFSSPRTGSTSLRKAIQLHPDIELENEPFQVRREKRAGKLYYFGQIHDQQSFNFAIDDIFSRNNAIKHHLMDVPSEYNKSLAKRNNVKPVFLYRKNNLQPQSFPLSLKYSERTLKWAVKYHYS